MKKRISKPFLIGIFAVVVFVGTFFGINFLKSRRVFSSDRIIYAVFPSADGLEVSAPVLIKGFKIGTVDKVSFDMQTTEVLVKLVVDGQYDLPSTSTAQIASTSILGGKAMEITLGPKNGSFLASGDTIKAIYAPGLTESLGAEYGKLKETATEVVEKFNKVLDGLNRALSEENTAALSATLANLRAVSNDLSDVTSSQKTNIKQLMANLASLSASLQKMAPDLERGLKNFSAVSEDLKTQAPQLIASVVGAVSNLNGILAKINAGEGTAGKLVSDNELYESLNTTVNSLNALLEDLKANPKRYINVSVFGGGNKEKKEKNL